MRSTFFRDFRHGLPQLAIISVFLCMLGPSKSLGQSNCLPGDVNDDGVVDIADAQWLLGFPANGLMTPGCLVAADVNGDGGVDFSDSVYILAFSLSGGPPPTLGQAVVPCPGPLTCVSYTGTAPRPLGPPDIEYKILQAGTSATVQLGINNVAAPVKGWALSIASDPGCSILSTTTSGGLGDFPPTGMFSGGIQVSDVTFGASNEGAVSSVLLTKKAIAPLPVGTYDLLHLTLSNAACALTIKDGLIGSGQPVGNLVAVEDSSKIKAVPILAPLVDCNNNAIDDSLELSAVQSFCVPSCAVPCSNGMSWSFQWDWSGLGPNFTELNCPPVLPTASTTAEDMAAGLVDCIRSTVCPSINVTINPIQKACFRITYPSNLAVILNTVCVGPPGVTPTCCVGGSTVCPFNPDLVEATLAERDCDGNGVDDGLDFAATGVAVPCTNARIPGDCNEDGALDLSDAVCLLGHVFLGTPAVLPCTPAAGTLLVDWNDDGFVDLSDAVYGLTYLFNGGPPHELGELCTPIVGCSNICAP